MVQTRLQDEDGSVVGSKRRDGCSDVGRGLCGEALTRSAKLLRVARTVQPR